jgi:peptidoglycan hydrolase CwlO-like protein
MNKLTGWAVLATLLILGAQPGLTQEPPPSEELKALKKEIEALKEGQTAIQKDLQEIKNLLRAIQPRPAEPRDVVLNIDGAPFKGDKDAKLVLVEFSEYQ